MENMKVNKKNNKPVICRTSIDILENKIKDLLYERETNLKMVEMAQEKNLSIITSQKEIIIALGEEIEKLKERLDYEEAFAKEEIEILKQDNEKLKELNKLECENAKLLLQESVSLQKEEVKEVITDKLNEDIEHIIKSKEEEDKKYFNTIQNLKDQLENSDDLNTQYFTECETLKEENIALRTFIRQNGLAKLHTKIKQLNEEITFLRTQAGLETFN